MQNARNRIQSIETKYFGIKLRVFENVLMNNHEQMVISISDGWEQTPLKAATKCNIMSLCGIGVATAAKHFLAVQQTVWCPVWGALLSRFYQNVTNILTDLIHNSFKRLFSYVQRTSGCIWECRWNVCFFFALGNSGIGHTNIKKLKFQ